MQSIHFFAEDVEQPLLQPEHIQTWITQVATSAGFTVTEINYIFCSDDYLLEINREHLQHDYYTDIITFDNSDEPNSLEGDIFISLDRVKDNADSMNISFDEELRRVLIHGVLHLLGQADKTEAEAEEMRRKEDACLSLYRENFNVPRGTKD